MKNNQKQGGISIKEKLKRIQFKNYFVNSYKEVMNDCFELYAQVNKGEKTDSESFDNLIEFTNEAIQEEENNFIYCKKLLDQLKNKKHYNVLYLRYFEFLTNEEVAAETFYSIGYTTRLTKCALKELEQIDVKEGTNGIKGK